MKKIRLLLAILLFSGAGFAQTCPDIILGGVNTTATPGNYQLYVFYTASTQNHIVDSIFSGTTLISTSCTTVMPTGPFPGSFIIPFSSPEGNPQVILTMGPGACGPVNSVCSRVFICPSCNPMPVTLSDFNATRKNNNVLLSWKTQSEINSSHFDVYRSYDNQNFDKIGTVATASANSNLVHNYSFADNSNNSASLSYYKLKIVDLDDRFTYSEIKTVKGSASGNSFIVYPNPASRNSTVTISNISGPTQVRILDNSGRVVKNVTLTSNSLDLSGIQKGNYILMIKGNASEQVRKLTVVD